MLDLVSKVITGCARIWKAMRFSYTLLSTSSENNGLSTGVKEINLLDLIRSFFQHAYQYDVCHNASLYATEAVMPALQWAMKYRYTRGVESIMLAGNNALFAGIDQTTTRAIDALLYPSNDPRMYYPIIETFLFPESFLPDRVSKQYQNLSKDFVQLSLYLTQKLYSEAFLSSRENTQLTLAFAVLSEQENLSTLLNNPQVQAHLRADHFKMVHHLWYALDNEYNTLSIRYRLPIYMLSFPKKFLGDNPLNEPWMVEFFLEKNAFRLKAIWENSFELVKDNLRKYLKLYGLRISQWISGDVVHNNALEEYVTAPEKVLTSRGYNLSSCLAVMLLKSHHDEVKQQGTLLPRSWRNSSNADDVNMAKHAKHFAEKIKPLLMPEIEQAFGNDFVNKIENHIRRDLLLEVISRDVKIDMQHAQKKAEDRKKNRQAATLAEKQELVLLENILRGMNWIKEKKHQAVLDTLLTGENEFLMSTVRNLFCSIENDAQVAWRGYDRFAPVNTTESGFPNLLTPQTSDKAVHTPVEIAEQPLTEKQASEEAREAMAITYYALMFRKKLDKDTRECRLTQIIARLAENRRANNIYEFKNAPAEGDNPTCIVGFYNRLYLLWEIDPELCEALNAKVQIERIVGGMVVKSFKDNLTRLSTEEEKTDLYHALIDLQKDTAEDYLKVYSFETDEEKQEYDREQNQREKRAKLRLDFVRQLGTVDSLLTSVNEQLKEENKPRISLNEKHYFKSVLLDIGGGWIANSLTEEYCRQVSQNNAHQHFTPQATQYLQQQRPLSDDSQDQVKKPKRKWAQCSIS